MAPHVSAQMPAPRHQIAFSQQHKFLHLSFEPGVIIQQPPSEAARVTVFLTNACPLLFYVGRNAFIRRLSVFVETITHNIFANMSNVAVVFNQSQKKFAITTILKIFITEITEPIISLLLNE